MNLNTHLKSKGLTDKTFADMIECERSFVTRLRHGDASASFKVMRKIEEATAGQVTAVDIYEARKARLSEKPSRKPKAKQRGRRYHHAAE